MQEHSLTSGGRNNPGRVWYWIFLLTKITAVQVQRIFYPTKITREYLGSPPHSDGLNIRLPE